MNTRNYPVGRCGWAVGVGVSMAILFSFQGTLDAQDAEAEGDASPEQNEFARRVAEISWQSEGKGRIGGFAAIEIPAGHRYADGLGASELLQAWGNPPSPNQLGVICNDAVDWGIFFTFEEAGYVKDDEKDELDPAKILKEKQKAQQDYNEVLKEQGLETWTVVGWAKEPFYNEETHNLEWGLISESAHGSRSVNYNAKLLGREGVTDAVLLCAEEDLESLMPTYRSLLGGFSYVEGKAYADYKSGDKVAKAGLTALIVGGSAVAAVKLGLFAVLFKFFAKAWKALILGLVAIGVGIKKMFSRGSGRLEE